MGVRTCDLNCYRILLFVYMAQGVFKSHAETLRMSTFRIILAIKAGYWKAFCDVLLDCSDTFQATRTDGAFEGSTPDLYCWPAPGFEKHAPNGERYYVCKLEAELWHARAH